MKVVVVVVAGLVLSACAHAPDPTRAATEALNARLLAEPSATAVLEAWCGDRRLASPARIAARRVGTETPAPPEVRAALEAGPGAPLRHRRVQLACGDHVLSEADNWYRPDRLTPEMNRTLDGTDAPFGRVVAPLDFTRRRLAVRMPDRREGGAVLEHRAVLLDAEGRPFSYVVERYTAAAVTAPAH